MHSSSTDTVAGRQGTAIALVAAALAAGATLSAFAAETCSARSAATASTVVELYTSEGCNSCPPADRWLSKLKADPTVVALAFHVDYWDRLGWKDRFASAAFTARQAEQQASNGARFSYTPQVVVDGQDRKDWPGIAVRRRQAAGVAGRRAAGARRRQGRAPPSPPPPASPKRLAAYWAVTEQGHVTAVKAGENRGATLQHDHVVREYQPVPAWSPQRRHAAGARLPASGAGRCRGASARGQPGRRRRRQRPARCRP